MLRNIRGIFPLGEITISLILLWFVFANGAIASSDWLKCSKVIISNSAPFLRGIREAEGFLYIGAYKLHDQLLPNPQIADALKDVATRSDLASKVIVILENNLTLEEQKIGLGDVKSGDSLEAYKKSGITIASGSPAFYATHFKILASKQYALVGTTNFDKEFEENGVITRDFSLILTHLPLIQELKDVLEKDVHHTQSKVKDFTISDLKPGETRLSWGPNQHRQHFKQLIQAATTSIEIYQQALQDEEITNLLLEAIEKGIKVSILMSEFPFGIKHGNKSSAAQRKIINASSINEQSTGRIRLTGNQIQHGPLKGKKLHIHAKVMIIDGNNPQKTLMYLGSANFYTPALDHDRNVGIITRDLEYIMPVHNQFLQDWETHIVK